MISHFTSHLRISRNYIKLHHRSLRTQFSTFVDKRKGNDRKRDANDHLDHLNEKENVILIDSLEEAELQVNKGKTPKNTFKAFDNAMKVSKQLESTPKKDRLKLINTAKRRLQNQLPNDGNTFSGNPVSRSNKSSTHGLDSSTIKKSSADVTKDDSEKESEGLHERNFSDSFSSKRSSSSKYVDDKSMIDELRRKSEDNKLTSKSLNNEELENDDDGLVSLSDSEANYYKADEAKPAIDNEEELEILRDLYKESPEKEKITKKKKKESTRVEREVANSQDLSVDLNKYERFYGFDSVEVVLRSPSSHRKSHALFIDYKFKKHPSQEVEKLVNIATNYKLKLKFLTEGKLDKLVRDSNVSHKGFILFANKKAQTPLKSFEEVKSVKSNFVVMTDTCLSEESMGMLTHTCAFYGIEMLILHRKEQSKISDSRRAFFSRGASELIKVRETEQLEELLLEARRYKWRVILTYTTPERISETYLDNSINSTNTIDLVQSHKLISKQNFIPEPNEKYLLLFSSASNSKWLKLVESVDLVLLNERKVSIEPGRGIEESLNTSVSLSMIMEKAKASFLKPNFKL